MRVESNSESGMQLRPAIYGMRINDKREGLGARCLVPVWGYQSQKDGQDHEDDDVGA